MTYINLEPDVIYIDGVLRHTVGFAGTKWLCFLYKLFQNTFIFLLGCPVKLDTLIAIIRP